MGCATVSKRCQGAPVRETPIFIVASLVDRANVILLLGAPPNLADGTGQDNLHKKKRYGLYYNTVAVRLSVSSLSIVADTHLYAVIAVPAHVHGRPNTLLSSTKFQAAPLYFPYIRRHIYRGTYT